jgi:hypothetical protein
MNVQILKRKVVADQVVAHVCQIICSIVAGLVLVLGIRRLAELNLDDAQLYSAVNGTLVLAGVFLILAFLCRLWRKSAQREQ